MLKDSDSYSSFFLDSSSFDRLGRPDSDEDGRLTIDCNCRRHSLALAANWITSPASVFLLLSTVVVVVALCWATHKSASCVSSSFILAPKGLKLEPDCFKIAFCVSSLNGPSPPTSSVSKRIWAQGQPSLGFLSKSAPETDPRVWPFGPATELASGGGAVDLLNGCKHIGTN